MTVTRVNIFFFCQVNLTQFHFRNSNPNKQYLHKLTASKKFPIIHRLIFICMTAVLSINRKLLTADKQVQGVFMVQRQHSNYLKLLNNMEKNVEVIYRIIFSSDHVRTSVDVFTFREGGFTGWFKPCLMRGYQEGP